ncbi:MAG: hypothetical protein QM729_15550 [Solirubrobacterales bacterium]
MSPRRLRPGTRRRVPALALAIMLVAAASGCGSGAGDGPAHRTQGTTAARTPAPDGGSPVDSSGACTREQARRAFVAFLTAFDAGDYAKLDSLFASPPAFRWFSSNPPGRRIRAASMRRRSLIAYFRRRHAVHDHMSLSALQVNEGSPHSTGLSFELRRSAADFRRGRPFWVSGKAALICHGGHARFIVVSIGSPGTGRPLS